MLTNAAIGAGEGIAEEAEGASPGPRRVVHAGIGVEDAATPGTRERLVGEEGKVRERHQRGAHEAEWDYEGR